MLDKYSFCSCLFIYRQQVEPDGILTETFEGHSVCVHCSPTIFMKRVSVVELLLGQSSHSRETTANKVTTAVRLLPTNLPSLLLLLGLCLWSPLVSVLIVTICHLSPLPGSEEQWLACG